MTRPDGSERGTFCLMCRQWIYNGHSDAPVVFIDSKFYKHPGTNLRWRYYRNDSTDTWYSLARNISSPDAPCFIAYGPAPSKDALQGIRDLHVPIPFSGFDLWSDDYPWAKAARAFFKRISGMPRHLIQNVVRCERGDRET